MKPSIGLKHINLLPLFLNVCHHDLRDDNFNSIYRKYVQHFYLQKFIKTIFKYLSNDTNCVS